jgi:hypothetical protein
MFNYAVMKHFENFKITTNILDILKTIKLEDELDCFCVALVDFDIDDEDNIPANSTLYFVTKDSQHLNSIKFDTTLIVKNVSQDFNFIYTLENTQEISSEGLRVKNLKDLFSYVVFTVKWYKYSVNNKYKISDLLEKNESKLFNFDSQYCKPFMFLENMCCVQNYIPIYLNNTDSGVVVNTYININADSSSYTNCLQYLC